MRFFNKYLVVALFVVAFMSSGGFIIDSSCSAAMKKCQACNNVHDDQIDCKDGRVKLCPACKRVHDSRINCKEAARIAQQGGGKAAGGVSAGGGKAATFLAAFTGAGAARTGSLTNGLQVVHSQGINNVSSNFTYYYQNGIWVKVNH